MPYAKAGAPLFTGTINLSRRGGGRARLETNVFIKECRFVCVEMEGGFKLESNESENCQEFKAMQGVRNGASKLHEEIWVAKGVLFYLKKISNYIVAGCCISTFKSNSKAVSRWYAVKSVPTGVNVNVLGDLPIFNI